MSTVPDLHPTQKFTVGDGPDLLFSILGVDDLVYPLVGGSVMRWRMHRGVMGAHDELVALDEGDAGVVIEITDAAAGEVQVSFETGTLQPGVYYHQLWLRNVNNEERMSAHGHIELIGAL